MALTKVTNSMIRSAPVNVLDFMTDAEISGVLAYSFATDVTLPCQTALDYARTNNLDCYFPAGGYLVTGLVIPGTVSGGTDDRDSAIRVYGQGTGEPFKLTDTGGTVIKSVTNAPVMQDILGTDPSSNGTIELDHIRFVGTSNANVPVVQLQSFYGLSTVHHCVFYQNGVGDGITIGFSATTHVYHNYSLNRDWLTAHVVGRVGKGFHLVKTYDAGLVTFSKNTSRGWDRGYRIGGGAGVEYSTKIIDCEVSVCANGIEVLDTRKTVIDSNYMEGIDGGFGIYNQGNYTVITNNLIFSGAAIGIDDRYTANWGTVIANNTVALGAVTPAIGIGVAGVLGHSVLNNTITCTDGTANQTGVYIDVQGGKIAVSNNAFDPRQEWTGAGSLRVSYTSTSDMYGIIAGEAAGDTFPFLAQGAVSLYQKSLTDSDVAANVLTISDGSYFVVTAAAPVTVNQIDAGTNNNRVVTFRTTNADMTFADTAYILSSGSFTGPGTITFVIERVGANSYAYEIARTVF
jgi:hypothetical protein